MNLEKIILVGTCVGIFCLLISWKEDRSINTLNETVFRDTDFRIGDDLIGTIPDQAFNRFSVTDLEQNTNFSIRTKSDKSIVLIGNTGTGISGLAIDASNGDGAGGDYATLYQYDDGLLELRNLSNSSIVFDIKQDRKVEITRDGDVFVNNSLNGVILKAPNGNCWKFTVGNSGNLIPAQVDCPI